MSPEGAPAPASLARDRLRRVLLGVVIGVVASGALALATVARRLRDAPPPPTLGTLPDFSLVDQGGRPFRASDLDGRLWVVDFVFTRCTSICPRLTERMQEIDRWAARHPAVAGHLGLLSITVDPAHDTPPVLAAYAREHGIDPQAGRWHLVTGEAEPLLAVVTGAFKIAVGDARTDERGRMEILHGGHLVVLDAERRIRGYFEAEPEGLRDLEATLLRLAVPTPPQVNR